MTQREWNRAEEFSKHLGKLRSYKKGLDRIRGNKKRTPIENPLSYLEELVNRTNVDELSPIDSNSDETGYRLSLQGVPLSRAITLLRTLSQDDRVEVNNFSLERVGLEGTTFDARFRIDFP